MQNRYTEDNGDWVKLAILRARGRYITRGNGSYRVLLAGEWYSLRHPKTAQHMICIVSRESGR